MSKEINEKTAAKETERLGLAALLQANDFIPEVMAIFKPEFFFWKEHGMIFTLITTTYKEKGSVDQTLLIIKMRHLGIKEVNGLDLDLYIKTLYNIPINSDHILDYFREIFKMHVCRKTYSSLNKAQTYINSNLDKGLSEILNEVQKITTDSVTANIEEKVKIVKVYDELSNFLLDRSKQEIKSRLITGFKIFDDWYGGLVIKGVYVFAAPAKVGKSTFLNFLAYQMAMIKDNNLKVLILDTELETDFAMSRAASSLTGENEFFFLDGSYVKHPGMTRKVNEAMKNLDNRVKDRIHHAYIGNMDIEEVLSVARRWYINNVKEGENALIIYDYIKLSGGTSQLSDHWKEYQEIGEKTDKLKKFISSLPSATLATSIQTNAQGGIAMSKQVLWFANNVYILQRKTLEEIQQDGKQNGTHKLIEEVTRNLGPQTMGSSGYFEVQNPDGRRNYVQNHLNFKFSNFKVEEVGTNQDVYSQRAGTLSAEEDNSAKDFF